MDVISWVFIVVFGIAFIVGVLLGISDYIKSKHTKPNIEDNTDCINGG